MPIKGSYLAFDGYHLPKTSLKKDQIDTIKKILTVAPIDSGYGGGDEEATKYKIYQEDELNIVIPRYYGIEHFGEPEKTLFTETDVKIKFTGTLRDYQTEIVTKCLAHVKKYGGGLMAVPCGHGKTSMSIYIASQLGLKTLVLTHKSFLQDQWVDRIQQFTKSRVGIIRQKTVDVENKDFVIGMIQSISKRNYHPKIFKEFGLVILDEAHRFGSKYFSNALYKVGAKYTIALTATPKRADGLMKVVNWFVGDIMYQIKLKVNTQVIAKVITFLSTDELFKEIIKPRRVQKFGRWVVVNQPDFVQMISNLINIKERNDMIVTILDTLRRYPDRKILVLSERIAHLKCLKEGLDKKIQESIDSGEILKDECKTYFYIGDTKRAQREEAEDEADILFGSFKMAEEGLDIERLNTIVLATPKKDVIQSCGRIMRKVGNQPLIIDISDKLSIFASQAKKREDYYTKSKYLQHYYYTHNGNLISPKKYLDLTKNSNNNVSDEIPKSFKDILEVPEVELVEKTIDENSKDLKEDIQESESEDEKPKKVTKSKKIKKDIQESDPEDEKPKKIKNTKKIKKEVQESDSDDEKPKKVSKKKIEKSIVDDEPKTSAKDWF